MSYGKTVSDMEEPVAGSGRCPMFCPQQKAVAVMLQVVHKFSKRGTMVVDPCTETGGTAKACYLEPKHLKFTD